MKITIDEVIKELESTKDYPASDPASDEALDVAIETLRKYQKIDQILDKSDNGEQCMYDTIQEIEELIRGDTE